MFTLTRFEGIRRDMVAVISQKNPSRSREGLKLGEELRRECCNFIESYQKAETLEISSGTAAETPSSTSAGLKFLCDFPQK
jgi:hypothetical protein